MDDAWKVIPGFNAYEAHPMGDIRNARRKTIMKKYQAWI